MQNNVIILFPESTVSAAPASPSRRASFQTRLQKAALIVDLAVSGCIGVCVLVCMGLVFTML